MVFRCVANSDFFFYKCRIHFSWSSVTNACFEYLHQSCYAIFTLAQKNRNGYWAQIPATRVPRTRRSWSRTLIARIQANTSQIVSEHHASKCVFGKNKMRTLKKIRAKISTSSKDGKGNETQISKKKLLELAKIYRQQYPEKWRQTKRQLETRDRELLGYFEMPPYLKAYYKTVSQTRQQKKQREEERQKEVSQSTKKFVVVFCLFICARALQCSAILAKDEGGM